MINPVTCAYCGSPHIRRSRRHSNSELLTMAIGTYPFRCLQCNGRFKVNVLLLSRLAFAKCPKCLGMELTSGVKKGHRVGPLKRLMMTFGARQYRCSRCRYNFASFRPLAVEAAPIQQVDEVAHPEDVAVHDEAQTPTEIG